MTKISSEMTKIIAEIIKNILNYILSNEVCRKNLTNGRNCLFK